MKTVAFAAMFAVAIAVAVSGDASAAEVGTDLFRRLMLNGN